jgi:hypothetical protein
MTLPKIYLMAFESNALGSGYSGQAVAEDGTGICGHYSSSLHFAKHDMGLTSDWKHDLYAKHYPNGYELEWVDNPDSCPGFLKAFELNMERRDDL